MKAKKRGHMVKRHQEAAGTWSSLELDTSASAPDELLNLTHKEDGHDASQALVRAGRFRPSFLMATNGGSTFEEDLRPPADRSIPLAPRLPTGTADGGIARSQLQNVIGGSDERRIIMDTSRIPARSIGLLKILPDDGIPRYGTAWLIGPRTLATAAHNLLHPQAGRSRQLDVAIAYDGRAARGGWHRVVDCRFSTAWAGAPATGSPYDFAVLKIENAEIGNRLGWLGFADYNDAKFPNMVVNLFGYPLDIGAFNMFGVAGRVMNFNATHIYYDCDAGGGMSGGPVIARFGEQRIAVGIHVAGGVSSNMATRIAAEAYALFDEYRSW